MSACLFADLSFFICLCTSCFSEMVVSKVKRWNCQNRGHIPFWAVCILYFIFNLIFPLHLFFSYVSFCRNRIVVLQQN